jgi:hypothetical protein
MNKADEEAGRMYHRNVRPMVKWMDAEWDKLSDDVKAICIDDAMDIVRIHKLCIEHPEELARPPAPKVTP